MEKAAAQLQNKHDQAFWAMPIGDVLRSFNTIEKGLAKEEIRRRLARYGHNQITAKSRRSALNIFASQFASPLIAVLLAAGFITIILGDFHDAFFILLAAAINALLGFYQENKAEKALDHLKSYITSRIRVTREGIDQEIDTVELVPGDIVQLRQGDRVPADVRIIHASELRVDQAILTGEALPIEKDNHEVAASAPVAERRSMAFMGTMITQGIGTAVVCATGDNTEFGRIAKVVSGTGIEQTPLQKALRQFTLKAAFIVILLSLVIFTIAIADNLPILDAFLISVAILVAAVPEGLPIVTTVILAIGTLRLAKRKGVVRRLTAAETLGSTSIILTDKTGTLTQANMSLASITVFEAEPSVKDSISPEEFLLHSALLNVDAIVENPKDHHSNWRLSGKPLEIAMVKAAAQRGVHLPTVKEGKEALHILPFSSLNKFSASLYKMPASWFSGRFKAREPFILSVLGAPDILLKFTAASDEEKQRIASAVKTMAARGERVIGVAVKEVSSVEGFHFKDHTHLNGLHFLGTMAFKDPLRPGAATAIHQVQKAGIRVLILTGDHEDTALAIAHELGLASGHENLIHGMELDTLDDASIEQKLKSATVIARVSPAGKLRVVKLLQKNGEIVAMTGDGINDAPALREANIGVAMGTGTDVSRDVSDLVLLDDNFETIVAAVTEGRRIVSNLRKAIVYLSSTLLNEVVLIGGALLVNIPNPINALQILWINVLTDSFPGIALAFENHIDQNPHAKPQKPSSSIFTREMKYLMIINGTISSVLLFLVYNALLHLGFAPEIVKTFTYACLGTYSLFIIASLRNLHASVFSYNPFTNPYLTASVGAGLILTLAAVYVPILQKYFDTVPLPLPWLAGVLGFGILSILLIELTKFFFRNKN